MNEPGSHNYNSTSWNNAVERSRIPRQFVDSIIAQHTGGCVRGKTRRGPFSTVESSKLTRSATTWFRYLVQILGSERWSAHVHSEMEMHPALEIVAQS